ncbi:NUDIX hydrolase [Leucobacter luti]|uniref:8-oxo-dGTP diphosphatase n=1 Tax=Leucobacter luti TaxID=340320 RepID=A0A4Q7U4H1_9MICO|nr:NUDIX domain-containing protein [Leucobacter luti]RZT68606.1 8-oxo-dGTP diphosphatase [Leucobacter luti]
MRYAETSASERRYLPPAVAVSVVAFALRPPQGAAVGSADAAGAGSTIWLPLVRRTRAPFLGQWALPGGPTEWHETLDDTALRSLRSATGRSPGHLEQLYSFGSVERSAEAQRLVTIAYWALYGEHELDTDPAAALPVPAAAPVAGAARRWDDPAVPAGIGPTSAAAPREAADAGGAGTDAVPANVAWFSADLLPPLAFDHSEIVAHALARLRTKTEYADVAHRFLGPEFTLGRLRAVTEAVLGQPVDPANFRRQALARGGLTDTGRMATGGAHRPARLYRFSASGASGGPGGSGASGGPGGSGEPVVPAQPAPAAEPHDTPPAAAPAATPAPNSPRSIT